MKSAFHYALCELKRRPRHTVSMIAASSAVLFAIILMMLWLHASWRESVLPENEHNYHFSLIGLTDDEILYIQKQPWVRVTYLYIPPPTMNARESLRVRVNDDEVLNVGKRIFDLCDRFGLWSRETAYARSFDMYRQEALNKVKIGALAKDFRQSGKSIEQYASDMAKVTLYDQNIANIGYISNTINGFYFTPGFFAQMSLFSVFMAGVMTVLTTESCRRRKPEFGCLRSLGMTRRQIVELNCFENLITTAASVPAAYLFTVLVVKLYGLLTRSLPTDGLYMTLTDEIPTAPILVVSLILVVMSNVGCLLVCLFERNADVEGLLRGEGQFEVSFVEKTSPRFERAKNADLYGVFTITRAKKSFFLGALIIAVMLPLPLWYCTFLPTVIQITQNALPVLIYFFIQELALLVTALTVIFVSTRSGADARSRELATLRSLGFTKRKTRMLLLAYYAAQSAITVAAAVFLFVELSGTSLNISSCPEPSPFTPGETIRKWCIDGLFIAAFLVPSVFGGMAASLRRFFRRSIIENIRETE